MNRHRQTGFTLIELAVVVVVIGLLLTGIIVPLGIQVETAKIQETQRKLTEIRAAVIGFAQRNGRLPCPTTHNNLGVEIPRNDLGAGFVCDDGGNPRQHGFVPAVTLGVAGNFNEDELLVDPWGNPYRYSVTDSDNGGDSAWDFVNTGEMRAVGIANLVPDLEVCSAQGAAPDGGAGDTATPADCNGGTGTLLSDQVPVLFYSLGPDGGNMDSYVTQSLYQLENAGESVAIAPATLGGYWIATDGVFVAGTRRGEPDSLAQPYFDDIVVWVSPVVLYERMIAAGQLP